MNTITFKIKQDQGIVSIYLVSYWKHKGQTKKALLVPAKFKVNELKEGESILNHTPFLKFKKSSLEKFPFSLTIADVRIEQ
jgi:hypothetical protein